MKTERHNRSRTLAQGLLFLALILLMTGCAPKRIPEPFVTPDQIRDRLTRPAAEAVFTATARVAVQSPRGRYSKTMVLAVKRPSFLRIESLPLFGPADLLLSTNGKTFQVFLPAEGAYYIGAATVETMHRFFGIALAPRHIVPLLTGSPPLNPTDGGDAGFRVYREEGRYRADLLPENGTLISFWLNPESKMLEEMALRDETADLSWSATFENFVQLEDRFYPGTIHVSIEKPERTTVTVRYRDMDVSADTTKDLFNLTIPPGIEPILLGE